MSSLSLEEIAAVLAAGEVVAVPTDTVYGLAVDPRLPGAAGRLFALKKRPERVALPVLIAEPAEVDELAETTPAAARLISSYWPGALTLVLARRGGLGLDLGGDPTTIGLRCPAHELLRELLADTGPLAVTSANRHGEPPLHTAEAVRDHFGPGLRTVLDGGRCDGLASTVLSLVSSEPSCLREGALCFTELVAVAAGEGGGASRPGAGADR